MNASRQGSLIFPTPLHIIDFDDLTFCDRAATEIKNMQDAGLGGGDHLCWTTPDDLHKRDKFQELTAIIENEINLVFDNIGLLRDSFYITCMWANISKPDNRHALHMHANSFYSGVIYLETHGNPGNIGFKDPRYGSELLSFDYSTDSIFKSRTHEVTPKKGRLIFFPSWLAHGTKSGNFEYSQNRISLSFNVMPRCTIQDFTRKLTL
jgi:uncharacterized protein (TIGR02466 family)